MKFEMDPDAMEHVTALVDKLFEDKLGPQVKEMAERKCPVDTGHLKSTIYFRVEMHKLILGATADYAAYVETGTKPHLITSHGDYPLRNRRTGQVFGRVVHHPGTRAQPFLRPAIYMNHALLYRLLGGV